MGPTLVALVALLSANCHVSRRKVQQLLSDVLGVDIALGTRSESEALATSAVDAPVQEAMRHALAAPVKHRRHKLVPPPRSPLPLGAGHQGRDGLHYL
jgi:hypothetical protein